MKKCQIIPNISSEIANIIAKIFDLKLLSIKDLIVRKIVTEKQTELGKKIDTELHSGNLIPTSLIIELLNENLKTEKNGILIMGFPRTKEHVLELKKLMENNDYEIDLVWLPIIKNPEKLISKINKTEIRKKIKENAERNKIITKELNKPEKVVKLEYEYPVKANKMEIERKIKAVHNTLYIL